MRRSRRLRSGFTLIEMMVVLAIIAVLLAVLVPALVRSKYQAHLSGCEHNERALASAMESYHTQFNAYPPSGSLNLGYPLFTGNFIRNINVYCPSNLAPYSVETTGDGDHYTVTCHGLHHLVLSTAAPNFPQYTPTAGLLLRP